MGRTKNSRVWINPYTNEEILKILMVIIKQVWTKNKCVHTTYVTSCNLNWAFTVNRIMSLIKEKEQQSEQHEQTLQRLQAKHETDISHFQHEHALSAAKVHSATVTSWCSAVKFRFNVDGCRNTRSCPSLTSVWLPPFPMRICQLGRKSGFFFLLGSILNFPLCVSPGLWGDRGPGADCRSSQTAVPGQWTQKTETAQGMSWWHMWIHVFMSMHMYDSFM